jgi:putative redox protein
MPSLDRSVSVQTTGDATTQTVANRRGHVLLADEPAALGGADRGFNPFELVAAGLGACTSMTLQMYARHKRIALAGVAVDLRFWRSGEGGFARDTIERKIKLRGRLSIAEAERLSAVARRCPVHAVIARAVEIRDEIEILPT